MAQELIERIDKDRSAEIALSFGSGLDMKNMAQAFEIAKAMAISGPCVPSYLRNNPGSCLFIIMRASRWGVDPFALAEKSYEVENKGEKRIAFESQVFRAVAESMAPIKGRMEHRYEGEGEDRVCIVYATMKGETDPREHKSPPLSKRRPAKNDYGKTKGSPLWDSKPDVQLLYDTQRDWVRINCPDVLMGIYTRDELEEHGFSVVGETQAVAALPAEQPLHHRLSMKAAVAAGFDAAGIAATMSQVSVGAPQAASANTNAPGFASGGQAAAMETSSPAQLPAAAADKLGGDGGSSGARPDPEPAADSHNAAAGYVAPENSPSDDDGLSAPSPPALEAETLAPSDVSAEPAAFQPPELPTDGGSYIDYVSAALKDPDLQSESAVRLWWGSSEAKRLRNGLPNFTPEIMDAAKKLLAEHIANINKA